jgi:two-component system NarL family sensor kinase
VEIHGVPLVVDGELASVYRLYQDVTELNKAQTAFRAISNKMDVLQQNERRKAARELYDSTAQELTALNSNLTRLNSLVSDDDSQTASTPGHPHSADTPHSRHLA